ncbi:MAG TPA: alginate export family protein [Chthoniobacterales bacterium]
MRGLPYARQAALATLMVTASPAFAGDMAMSSGKDKSIVPAKTPETNPLSFFDGALVFDVQERIRGEYRENNYDFNSAVDAVTDDSWLLLRFRLGLAIKPVSWLKIYAQAQDSREAYSDRADIPNVNGAEGDDAFDLRQGYIMIGETKGFSLTAGRQILSYGDERLVGPLDWSNLGRTFDAVKARYAGDKFSVDLFASTVVVFERGAYNQSDFFNGNETHRDQVFAGVYFSTTLLDFQTTDGYAFYLHEDQKTIGTESNFGTIGGRVKSNPKKFNGFDYDAEAAFQFGDLRSKDLLTGAVHVGGGYTFLETPWKPRIGVEYNFASGDSDPNDGDVETFQNLFPTNHKFYGYMDLFSWQNIHNPAISFKVSPVKTLTVQADGHLFWLADTSDAWYRANGTPVRPITPSAGSYVGAEIDLTATWKPSKHYSLQAGYSHFFAGEYVDDTGPGSDADFGYLMATVDF